MVEYNSVPYIVVGISFQYIQPPPKVLEQKGQFLFLFFYFFIYFLQYTEYFWGSDKKMNMRRELKISPFISWFLNLDVLNYLVHSTFGIRPPNF